MGSLGLGPVLAFTAGWVVLSLVSWAAMTLMVRILGSRLPTVVRKFAWLILMAKMVVPLGLALPVGRENPTIRGMEVLSTVGGASPSESGGAAADPGPRPLAALNPGQEIPVESLAALWVLVSGGLVVSRLRSVQKWRRWARRGTPVPTRWMGALETSRRRLGLSHLPRALVLVGLGSPALTGFFRPTLVLPPDAGFTDEQLAWMADHELNHLQAGDTRWLALVQGLTAVFWFLPGLWLSVPRLASAIEADCDRRVLEHRGPSGLSSYARTILAVLELTSSPRSPGTAMAPTRRQLAERFRTLGQVPRPAGLPLALLVGALVVTGIWGLNSPDPILPPGLPWNPGTVWWVTAPFGTTTHPFSGKPYVHTGIDIAERLGSPVICPWAGRVAEVSFEASDRGYFLRVDHGGGWQTLYAHLKALPALRVGDPVAPGQQIALVGQSGLSTGPHLHWEVIHDGKAIDPAPWVRGEPSVR